MHRFLSVGSFFIAHLIFLSSVIGQEDMGKRLSNALSTRNFERGYLHSNQYQYVPGEHIFYKVYLLVNDLPSIYSRNLYIEWYNQDGRYLQRQVLPTVMGMAAGDFLIPATYIGQRIYAKLFTVAMRQANDVPVIVSSFIVNQSGQQLLAPAVGPDGLKIRVQPEGGTWVAGIPSILTIRTENGNQVPLGMNCRILNSKGELVSMVSTAPHGFAQVEVTPDDPGTYFIQVELPDGTWKQQSLPEVQSGGVSLRADPTNFSFVLQRLPDAPPSQQEINLLLFTGNELWATTTLSLEQKLRVKGRFNTDSLPAGFYRLIWQDKQQQVLGQRVLYLHPPKEERLVLNTDTLSFDKKGLNVFTIKSTDTTFTSLSVAITDAAYEEVNLEKNIYQLMGWDVFKEYPAQMNLAAKWLEDQQYRLFDQWLQSQDLWLPTLKGEVQEGISSSPPTIETGYITINGKVENLGERKTKKAGAINLIIATKDDEKDLTQAELAGDGSFSVQDLFYYDSITVYLQPNGISLSDQNKISLRTNLLPAQRDQFLNVPALVPLPAADSMSLLQRKYASDKKILDSMLASTTLKEVVVTTRVKSKIEQMDEKFTTGLFTSDGIRFDITSDNFANMQPNVFSYLQGRVAGLQISLQTFGRPSLTWRGDQVAVFLNEVQLTDPSALNNIPMSDVAYIKVFRPPFFGAYLGGSGGAIAVYTRRGDEGGIYDVTGLQKIKLEGYARPTSWETIVLNPDEKKKPIKDIRKTIYWNSSVPLDKEVNQFIIRFNNNDVTTRYRLIAEGFNKEGRLVRYEKIIGQ